MQATRTSYLSDSLDGLPDKDRQSAKTRDNSEICRYAPPSCSPEDGNLYDQDTSISTDDPQPEGLTGPTAGGFCDTLTADGDIREDSQAKHDGSAITRNETLALDALDTSANHYGDAATREGADVSTTVSLL